MQTSHNDGIDSAFSSPERQAIAARRGIKVETLTLQPLDDNSKQFSSNSQSAVQRNTSTGQSTGKMWELYTPTKQTFMTGIFNEIFEGFYQAQYYAALKSNNSSPNVQDWTSDGVKFWANWLNDHLNVYINTEYLPMSGLELSRYSKTDICHHFVLNECSAEVAYSHLEFLKKSLALTTTQASDQNTHQKKNVKQKPQPLRQTNGPIHLWQFLLNLLLNVDYRSYITWTARFHQNQPYRIYEFKILNPEGLAKLWGQRKNKPNMNYEKLSRGLRYYYDKKIIQKTSGARYVYQFGSQVNVEQFLAENDKNTSSSSLSSVESSYGSNF